MSSLFGFFTLGLSSLRAAQTGLQVAGDNIANVNTPGFNRRTLQLTTGFPQNELAGQLSDGVRIRSVRRAEDPLIQSALDRERGGLSFAGETLRGLRQLEGVFGSVQGDNLSSLYAEFSDAFSQLGSQPTDTALRRNAVSASEQLADSINNGYGRLEQLRRDQDINVRETVAEINRLSAELVELNTRAAQGDPREQVNAPVRDQRQVVVERLSELTGGSVYTDERGSIQFLIPQSGSLISASSFRSLELTNDAEGLAQVSLGGVDITAGLRSGELGAQLALRDDAIVERQQALDAIAEDLIATVNPLVSSAQDLDGNPGIPLFLPDPSTGPGVAANLRVNPALDNPRLLAVSATGAPGDGSLATQIAALGEQVSATLGNKTPVQYITDFYSELGGDVARAALDTDVATGVVQGLEAQRDAVVGVSLDEEALEILRYQRSYEAAARFISVLNDITLTAVNLGN